MDINILKQRKKEMKLTFNDLSTASGVPIQTLHNIFRGHTENPRIDTMQAIERALGLDKGPEWTEEENALGVGNYPVKISDDEYKWLELRSELLRVMGEDYVKTTESLLQAIIEKKDEKS